MRVLIACEFSGIVRDAFAARGHEAWSCDLLSSERPGKHLQHDIEWILTGKGSRGIHPFDLMIAHPPCTFLTNAGVRHLHSVPSRNGKLCAIHGPARWKAMKAAAKFFKMLLECPIPKVACENPIPHGYAVTEIGRKYDQLIQPWQFGHGETKATCLWLKGLPKLNPTNIVAGREARIHKMSPSKNRSHERSRTYEGIAAAMAAQWGITITEQQNDRPPLTEQEKSS